MTKLVLAVTAGAFIGAFASELFRQERLRSPSRLRAAARQFCQGFMEGLHDDKVGALR